MDKMPKRLVQSTTVIKYEMDTPVDRKHWSFMFSMFLQEFENVKGREPTSDNDWWIEASDGVVSLCFVHEEVKSADRSKTNTGSTPVS